MLKQFLDLMFSPGKALKAELSDPRNNASYVPGLIWLAIVQGFVTLVMTGFAWGISSLLGALQGLPTWFSVLGMTSPLSAILWGIQFWILSCIGFFCFTFILDF